MNLNEYNNGILKNKSTKFRANNWVEINDNACGMYNTNSQLNFQLQC